MKVLVFGANGWIGRQFINILQDSLTEYKSATCRADDYEGILSESDFSNPFSNFKLCKVKDCLDHNVDSLSIDLVYINIPAIIHLKGV
jgi:nucleoside-diphosphate-sugar epimerase